MAFQKENKKIRKLIIVAFLYIVYMAAHNAFFLYTKKYPHDFILPTRVLSSYKMFRFDLPKHVM